MSKVKKILVGAAVIVGVLIVEIVVQNLTGFRIPEEAFAPAGAMVGIAVYKYIEEKVEAKEK